ncbi:ABC transporter ATP-binding protein [Propionimicrobium lymphophilum]|uniref:ABC transporter domain-containing protein n=1 Tax=Propionimicrobium lymphophilum ACS-093-V-SCH5 TaxID=883161 RepID=S2W073_9ACTN|nr:MULTISPECIES: ABC transporter ATP-binding protein [Propionimicrobium]EPD32531.1 hypothetical protein HMPREF9306_02103 [Propionimicrobium lymphophilum ACS-093-V-SCH5]ETJ97044.1 ABC transporter, ATP-binding protein [Propionimicrobium sp. BV2F7]MDK7710510.1 ABC transporter ATP-binding protein [Propionimicrobium lymphophilum]MDK7734468.1 ABC transporter ATP-binding protein [Propionimicrobium lymphophilum]
MSKVDLEKIQDEDYLRKRCFISVRGVAAAVGGYVAVKHVSFDVPYGTKLALVGTNGAGKSTLLRALAGINPAVEGIVRIGERDVTAYAPKTRARIISFVGQEESPPAALTLGEMVNLGRIPHRAPWSVDVHKDRDIVVSALAQVGLDDRIDSACDHLSGGERRRAMIARGLAQGSPIFMLDEPTNHLDIAWQLKLLKLLTTLECTVVAAIHDLDLVLRNFDMVAVMHAGSMIAFGEPKDVINTQLMDEAFRVEAIQAPNPVTHETHLLISKGKEEK